MLPLPGPPLRIQARALSRTERGARLPLTLTQ